MIRYFALGVNNYFANVQRPQTPLICTTMSTIALNKLVTVCIDIARTAGREIKRIYEQVGQGDVSYKDDKTPLTEADLASHRIIYDALQQLTPDVPVLSEEGELPSYAQRQQWTSYWLVDPLDGTREFIDRTGEFCVNIAMVEDHEAVLGVIYSPLQDILYYACQCGGAFKVVGAAAPQPIMTHKIDSDIIRVTTSRRHGLDSLQRYLPELKDDDILQLGSALKIGLIAEGGADLYPRTGPTSEWDTAAGQCIITEAGGALLDFNGQSLRYNDKDSVLNPYFIAIGDPTYEWQTILQRGDNHGK